MCKIFQKAKGVILFFLDMSFNLPHIFYVGHFQSTSPIPKSKIQSSLSPKSPNPESELDWDFHYNPFMTFHDIP